MRKHVCKAWCSHCRKREAQINSCLKGSGKARVIPFVEETASFTKFQVNTYRKEYFGKATSKHIFRRILMFEFVS